MESTAHSTHSTRTDPLPPPSPTSAAAAAVGPSADSAGPSRSKPKRPRSPASSEQDGSQGDSANGQPATKRAHLEPSSLASTGPSTSPSSAPAPLPVASRPVASHPSSSSYPPGSIGGAVPLSSSSSPSSLALVPPVHDTLPPTIFGATVTPDIHLAVCNFVYATISRYQSVLASRPNAIVEVEAKLGRLVDARGPPGGAGDQRIYLPVTCETELVAAHMPTRFVSNMDMALHRHFNRMLNELVVKDKRACKYTHTILVDRSHSLGGDKYRETRDKKTGAVVDRTRKTKLAHLDIYVPGAPLDYRVSVAIEEPWTELPSSARMDAHERVKDRISYAHALVQVDLTMVHSVPVGQQPTAGKPPTYELEVEFVDAGASVLREKAKMDRGEPNRLKDNIVHLVNNIRYLAGKAIPPEARRM